MSEQRKARFVPFLLRPSKATLHALRRAATSECRSMATPCRRIFFSARGERALDNSSDLLRTRPQSRIVVRLAVEIRQRLGQLSRQKRLPEKWPGALREPLVERFAGVARGQQNLQQRSLHDCLLGELDAVHSAG